MNHPFSHGSQHPQHVERLGAYWAEVLGNPKTFSERCGDETQVLTLHWGNRDLGDLPERFYRCFVQALHDARFPGDPEVRAALHAYMRWAVDNVMAYSAVDATVPAGLPMPRCGWDGLENSQ